MSDAVKRVEWFFKRTSKCDDNSTASVILPSGHYDEIYIGDIRAIIEENKSLRNSLSDVCKWRDAAELYCPELGGMHVAMMNGEALLKEEK